MSAGRRVNTLRTDWCTPKKYVDAITEFFDGNICLDPCSNEYSIVNAKIEYKLPEHDGLNEDWCAETIFVNPPYGSDRERKTTIKDWLRKCCETYEQYITQIIALVPVATNTSHWKQYVFYHASAICFLYDTRLKFLENGREGGKGAPMACCLIYYGWNIEKFKDMFEQYGYVVTL